MGNRYEPWLTLDDAPTGTASGTPSPDAPMTSYPAAVRQALVHALHDDDRVFVMGQDVDAPNGMFGCTADLHKEFGRERCFDTPLSETALMGVAVGAALADRRPVYCHNRPDFLYLALDQLANHAAKWHYMFDGKISVPLVVWTCAGRGWGSAAQHSQTPHAVFAHIPGLKVAMPSTPADAKGLLLSAIADPDPVVILEHRFCLRTSGPVPPGPYRVPLGKAAVRRAGGDVSLVGASWSVNEAMQAADRLAEKGVSAEVLDLRTIKPIDAEAVCRSVRKTGRLVACDTGWLTGGLSAEIVALATERCWPELKAAPRRVALPDAPTPAGHVLEAAYYPGVDDIVRAAEATLENP